jgi:hypothetical protein
LARTVHDRSHPTRLVLGLACVAAAALGPFAGSASARPAAAISNEAAPGYTVGSPIYDTATLGGGVNPTGTITFRLFGPADSTCAGTPVFTSVVSAPGRGFYRSANFVPSLAGTYRWTAAYSGDADDTPASSRCDDNGAGVDVAKQRPALRASATVSQDGSTTTDVVGVRGQSPTGTFAFKLYGPASTTCTGTPVFTSSRAVAGDAKTPSAPFTAAIGGDYRWVVVYSGDANNEAAWTSCADPANVAHLTGGGSLAASPTLVIAGTAVTLRWSGVAAPSTTDWVGLFAAGAPDSAPRAWRYTPGGTSGTINLKVPWNTLPGIYEVRLFGHNSYDRLARPAPITVL